MKVLVVDDHILFRQGLISLLRAEPDFEVCGQAGSLEETIYLARQLQPDLVLMDYSLPDGTGVEATQAILAENPDAKIVFLTVHEADEALFAAIRSGAQGYLLKSVSINKLIDYLRAVQEGGTAFSSAMSSRILKEFARTHTSQETQNVFTTLTARETEILRTMINDASNQEIAEQLFLSENTVKRHVHSILTKLNLPNRHAVIRFAKEQGFK